MDLDTHPNPQPNPHHRKVDLQSSHDLTYLQNNLAQSALQKLDLHFPKISQPATHISLDGNNNNNNHTTTTNPTPPATQAPSSNSAEEEDPMRRRVRELVSEFLHTTWTSAGHNIAVNGNGASTLPLPHTATLSDAPFPVVASSSSAVSDDPAQLEIEGVHYQYSAFDGTLQRKLAALHGELDALTAQVARLRREAPARGAQVYGGQLRAAMEADDARYEAELEGDGVQELRVQDVREGWNEDVKEIYERGIQALARLAGVEVGSGDDGVAPTLTETVGKAQRARKVALELE